LLSLKSIWRSEPGTGAIPLPGGHSEPQEANGTGTTTEHPKAQSSARSPDWSLAVALRLIQAGPLVILLAIWIGFAALSPHFLTPPNLTNILIQSSSVALLALGALLIVMVGSLDLSLGATVGLCTIVSAVVFREFPAMGWVAIPAALATGAAIGAVNSFVIVTLRTGNAFIVTLGMLYVVQSLSYTLSGGSQVPGAPEVLVGIADGRLFGIPGPIVLLTLAAIALWIFLNRVVWGRWIVAIGGSADAASKVGMPVKAVLFSVYVIGGMFAAVAGLLVAGRNQAGTVDNGTSILLAIAAVVIGGASLTGGRGSVWATVVGAVILGSITNGLTLVSVAPNWTPFAVGGVLVAAVGLETLRTSVERRLRVRQAQIQAGVST
jgi:ribose transport system permease protein